MASSRPKKHPYARYAIKRLIQGAITVWLIATATFFAMHNVPGDPLLDE